MSVSPVVDEELTRLVADTLDKEPIPLPESRDLTCSIQCGGSCCRSFNISLSPIEFGKRRLRQEEYKAKGEWFSEEIIKITDMLIYQGKGKQSPLGNVKPELEQPGHWYTCKHFQEESGTCGNYEERPGMCSRYPYGDECQYFGCGGKSEGDRDPQELPQNFEEDRTCRSGCGAGRGNG